MHPEYSKVLLISQIQDAIETPGLFDATAELEEWSHPNFFIRFKRRSGGLRLLVFNALNYDFQPLAVELVDPETRIPVDFSNWPKRDGQDFPPHPMKNNKPFFCMTGVRDYYTHPAHSPSVPGRENWDQHRANHRVADVVRYIKAKFVNGSWD